MISSPLAGGGGRVKQPTLSQNFVPSVPRLIPHSFLPAFLPDDVVPAGHASHVVLRSVE